MIDYKEKDKRPRSLDDCGFDCFHKIHECTPEESLGNFVRCSRYTHRRWLLLLSVLFMVEWYYLYNYSEYRKDLESNIYKLGYANASTNNHNVPGEADLVYKYSLKNSSEILMDYKHEYNSSYYWFMSMKHLFKNIGEEETRRYSEGVPSCQLNESSLGPILVDKSIPDLKWVEDRNTDVSPGGYYAPVDCRASHRVAIIVPYRNRKMNLAVLLRYLHPFLKKQLLEYRIFVIEQYGIEQFNKGTLYNIAFLESQRFGSWDCLIFHDVDLIPEDERISYTCMKYPTHMSPSVESQNYNLAYETLFGGVTSLMPDQYIAVNGYSNFYWSWGAEDDDMYIRLQSAKLPMLRYNSTIARFATLPHERNRAGKDRYFFLDYSKLRYQVEGLRSTKYKLLSVVKRKLYTHILADVNPIRMKIAMKSIMRQLAKLFGNKLSYSGAEVKEGELYHVVERKSLTRL
ncbi:beta-1,4-N-acetylgalactosaminyltransferase bre-4-like isoform X1 [Trichoplusia ni]|uniref:Beta-1,4-N-acetylgalactosaminyltransferase n=1 Tax=Trichoplusia ni TaxID=7111 RepID=A0A7E5W5Q3_TRINI|nr:beta-1,4-N-acetylgalactosaminyltransferase bre-4-like isoform X1 [Trichoplusia ni]XP_026735975.1 beta-1,4-N-acetylgalactosaminyltransferase bre-4-like isoform X1 [Trichoplusia ni]